MRNQNLRNVRRLGAAFGFGALAVLSATAIHTGIATGSAVDVQAKGNPTGLATASIAPTMQMGQTVGRLAPATTTLPNQ
ncbi:MAG: hypothetical protein ACOYBX_16225 [Mycobacterium sp.]